MNCSDFLISLKNEFNVYNLACSLLVCLSLGFKFEDLVKNFKDIYVRILGFNNKGQKYKIPEISKNYHEKYREEYYKKYWVKLQNDYNTFIEIADVQALTDLTRENFKVSLNQAYSVFEQKTTDNLHKIIEETHRIIQENKINLGSFTTIDWINLYFENAKTTSDEYMQMLSDKGCLWCTS